MLPKKMNVGTVRLPKPARKWLPQIGRFAGRETWSRLRTLLQGSQSSPTLTEHPVNQGLLWEFFSLSTSGSFSVMDLHCRNYVRSTYCQIPRGRLQSSVTASPFPPHPSPSPSGKRESPGAIHRSYDGRSAAHPGLIYGILSGFTIMIPCLTSGTLLLIAKGSLPTKLEARLLPALYLPNPRHRLQSS